MRLVERAKNIIVSPKTEWDAVAADPTPTKALVTGYVLPLAAAAAVAAFIGLVFVGVGPIRFGFAASLVGLVFNLVMAVAMVFVVGFIIDALAPTFGGQKSMDQAVKVAAYSYTPVWVVGVLAIIPALGMLGILGGLYAIYLLYLGLPRLMKAPQEKAAGYTAVVVVVAIVAGFIIATVGAAITGPATIGSLGAGAASSVTIDKDSPAGKMEEFARRMEEAGRKAEEAEKSGDPQKQMEAALGVLGTALSGGKAVEPVQLDALRPLLPESVAGLPRTATRADRSGVAGLMAATVEGEYEQGDKRIEFKIVDTGGAMGLMAMAAWAGAGAAAEKEDADHRERMYRDGNRLVHEEASKTGGSNRYSVVLAERFVVEAEGQGVDLDALKKAVNGIDLAKIESLR